MSAPVPEPDDPTPIDPIQDPPIDPVQDRGNQGGNNDDPDEITGE